jgi:O-antigen/teichoic acid export membrane protein
MTGTVIAQLISLLGLIYVQRYYYGPEEFANFKLFYEFAAIFVGVSALRLESGIVLEKDDSKARSLTKLSLKLVLITGLISFISLIIFAQFDNGLAAFYNNKLLLVFLPIVVVLSGFIQVFNSWFTREKSFKTMSGNKVAQNSSSVGGQLSFALLNLKNSGLIYGRLVGLFIANLFFMQKYFSPKNETKSQKGITKELLVKNKKFILFTSPSVLLSGIINFLLIDLFMQYYGEDFSGKIGSAYHYLGISIAVITTSFAQVYYSKLSSIDSKEELRKNYTFWFLRLFSIAFIGVITVHFIPNTWDEIILGEAWDGSLEIMKIMSIWMGIMFVSSSLSYIYIKLGRQKEMLLFDIVHIVLVYGCINYSHTIYNDGFISLWWFTIAQSCFYLLVMLVTFIFISKYKPETSK